MDSEVCNTRDVKRKRRASGARALSNFNEETRVTSEFRTSGSINGMTEMAEANRKGQRVAASLAILLFIFAAAASSWGDGADLARTDLPTRLAQFDATVLPPQERQATARLIEEGVQRRLRESNDGSSAQWKTITSRAEWERFRTAKLAALRESLGQPATPVPLRQRVTGALSGEGYRIENIVSQSRPGLWITANLYRPDKPRPSMPGILISHAHHTPKEHGELQDMGVTWARSGCLVLEMDQLGHGERRQHPFRSAADYARPFQISRQDYYFRYDAGIQLHLVGESLIGWIAWDLMRGLDLLLAQENIDPKRIILLGAVAGGGDPAAVAAALDERIAAVVPFNFGGPQPETRYPLPEDAETWFNYAGSGSWESTRNLRRSAADGFLPWVIVGGIAPRRLVYGHEFSWDSERDPVWKRLQTIYGFYHTPDHLAFTHGRGELRGQPPEATHCTHIGPPHRRLIHAAFKEWFGINVTGESSDRHPAEALRAMTPDAERELRAKKLTEILSELGHERVERARRQLSELSLDQRRRHLQADWSRLLGNAEPLKQVTLQQIGTIETLELIAADVKGLTSKSEIRNPKSETDRASSPRPPKGEKDPTRRISVERILITVEPSIVVPVILLKPESAGAEQRGGKPPVVVAMAQAGKQELLRERASEIAALLDRGTAVCLPDVRGTGETSSGTGRGRRSAATSLSSSELMLGGTMLGAQLRDLRAVLAWLRTRHDLDARQLSLWGDSLTRPNPSDANFQIPRDDDDALPKSPEPLAGLLALLAALYEEDVRAVYVHGGLAGFESVLTKHLVLIPHDAVVPGALTAGDLCDLVAALAPRRIRLEGMVDGWNRTLSAPDLASAYQPTAASYRASGAAAQFSFSTERTFCVHWVADGTADRAR
jgi:dienelactone hydrolase